MWEERKPEPGETVKIEFATWTGMGTQIGIYLNSFDGKAKIQFGRVIRYLELGQTFVWNPKFSCCNY